MTTLALDPPPLGGMPCGGRLGGASEGPSVAGVSTTVVHATCDQILARLSSPEAGVVVSSVDVQEVDRLARRVEAVRLALVAVADRQQVHRRCGHSSTSAWVASATRSGGAAAARDVALATALADGLDRTRVAFEAGEVSRSNAGIIARTMGKLPETIAVVGAGRGVLAARVTVHGAWGRAGRDDHRRCRRDARRRVAGVGGVGIRARRSGALVAAQLGAGIPRPIADRPLGEVLTGR